MLRTAIKAELGAAIAGFFLRGQAVGQEQAVHTAADILISAYSPRAAVARQSVGVPRNTDRS